MTQPALFKVENREPERHADTPASSGKCGTKLLMRSKKDPSRRRWQCTSQKQSEAFHTPRARAVMSELGKTGITHLAANRRENPDVQALVDHGLITLKTNPKHYNYEFQAKITSSGRRWLREQAAAGKAEGASKQPAMSFKEAPGARGAPPRMKARAPKPPRQAGLFKGSPVFMLELVLEELAKADRDGIKPITEVGADTDQPVRTSWDHRGYRCDYRQVAQGLGSLTISGRALPMPFHVVCTSLRDAQSKCPGICAMLDQGKAPEFGLYRRTRLARGRRGVQGGHQLAAR